MRSETGKKLKTADFLIRLLIDNWEVARLGKSLS